MKTMQEMLEVYDLQGNALGAEERDKFYEEVRDEFKRTGKVTRQVEGIHVLALHPSGRIYIQKRSASKKENAGLYDKTVGGHVMAGHTPMMTLVRECAEELGFPAVVVPAEDFPESLKTINLEVVGVFREIKKITGYLSLRKSSEGDFTQPYINTFFFGYYGGSLRFRDGEASGIETFSIEELQSALAADPQKFTGDLKFIVDEYSQLLKPLS